MRERSSSARRARQTRKRGGLPGRAAPAAPGREKGNRVVRKIYQPHLSTVRDARALRTRHSLRRALLELLETKSFDQITLRDIASKAGIGYTTFFRHHPTKEALLHEIAAEQIRRLVSLALPILEMSDPHPSSLVLARYVDEHRKLWSTLLTGGAAGTLREEFLKVSTEVAASWPYTSSWRPTEIAIILVVSSTIELLAWWLRQKKPLSAERIAEIHARFIIMPAIAPGEEGAAKPRRRSRK